MEYKVYEEHHGDRITLWIPKWPKFPDASRAASLEAMIDDEGIATINRLRTQTLLQKEGRARALIGYLHDLPGVHKIVANADKGAERFYEKLGFRNTHDRYYELD